MIPTHTMSSKAGRILIILGISCVTPLISWGQQTDTTPPQLLGLSVNPPTIDVTQASQTLTVTMHVTDDLSGTVSVTVVIQSPSAAQTNFAGASLIQGTALDGTWVANLTIPRFVESGVWKISSINLQDEATNHQQLGTAALQSLGLPTSFDVQSNQDLSAPRLGSFSISPSTIDVSTGQQSATITMGLTDSPAGVDFSCPPNCAYDLYMTSPSGRQTQLAAYYDVSKVSGTAQNGVWQTTFTLPHDAEAGNWNVSFVVLYDLAGNGVSLNTAMLKALGFPTTLTVTSATPDTIPPVLTNLLFGPNFVNTSLKSEPITITLGAADNLSGLDFVAGFASPHFNFTDIAFTSPSGQQSQFVTPYSTSFKLQGGTAVKGTWTASFTLPQFSEAGTWEISSLTLKDTAGNYLTLNTSQLQAMGFQTALIVVLPSLTSDGTIPTSGGTVQDTVFGSRAAVSFPPGILASSTGVAIDVFTQTLHLPVPSGFAIEGTDYVNIQLIPEPSFPLPAPGANITLPTTKQMAPGAVLKLFKVDPVTGNLIPERSLNGGIVTGTVDPSGISATFTGLAALSVVVGLIPSSSVPGDIDGDGKVDCTDIAIVKGAFGKRVGQTGFDSRADVNNNGIVDISDLAFVSRQLPAGTVCRFASILPSN
jgi:Dockerin type I domain